LADVAYLYHRLAEVLSPLKQIKLTGKPLHDKKYIPDAAKIFLDAMQIEDKAIKELEKNLCDYINNKNFNPSRLKHLY
jgi:hypothetical protein